MRFGLIALVAVVLALVGTTPTGHDIAFAQADDTSVEYKLAAIEAGGYVAPDDPLVLAYANVLDRVQPRCNESRFQLGSIASAMASKVEQESPYGATPLSLLRGLDEAAIPELYNPDHPGNCAEMLGVLAYLASQGD